jgi:hypothetical protein
MKKRRTTTTTTTTGSSLPRLTARYFKKDWKLVIPTMSAPQRQGVAFGVDTWRSFDTKKLTWFDWAKISQSLEIGEAICAEAAGKSEGGKYARLLSGWLKENGLNTVDDSIRSWLREIRRHQSEIDAWRNSLPIEQRVKMNHPKNVLKAWRKHKASQQAGATS